MSSEKTNSLDNPEVQKEILKHHKSLKQFIDVSFDKTNAPRVTSSRAIKAREKLLKLSQAQFIELSTDVYDELQRRINESREEPDHLLPRDNFHPKRNQARKKLASLPAQRFKDLVNDILFEIERRGLHDTATTQPFLKETNDEKNKAVQEGKFEPIQTSSIIDADHFDENQPDDETPAERDVNSKKNSSRPSLEDANGFASAASQHGIHSKTVIPTKATMAWSSDEEDNDNEVDREDEQHEQDDEIPPYSPQRAANTQAQAQAQAQSQAQSGFSSPDHAHNINQSPQSKNFKSHLKNSSSISSTKRGVANGIDKDREIQMLLQEGTKMDDKITELERLLALSKTELKNSNETAEILKSENSALLSRVQDLENQVMNYHDQTQSKDDIISQLNTKLENFSRNKAMGNEEYNNIKDQFDALQKTHSVILNEHSSLEENYNKIKQENENLKARQTSLQQSGSLVNKDNKTFDDNTRLEKLQEKLEALVNGEIDNKSIVDDEKNEENYKAQILKWQRRYEKSRSEKINDELIKADLSENELKPYITEQGLISSKAISDFQSSLELFYLLVNGNDFDVDILYTSITSIVTKASAICGEVDSENNSITDLTALCKAAASHCVTVARYYMTSSPILPLLVVNVAVNEVALSVCDLVKFAKIQSSDIIGSGGDLKNNKTAATTSNNTKNNSKYGNLNLSVETPSFMNPTKFENNDSAASPVRPLKMIERLNSPSASTSKLSSDNVITRPMGSKVAPIRVMSPSQSEFSSNVKRENGLGVSGLSLKTSNIGGTSNNNNDDPRTPDSPKFTKGSGIASLASKFSTASDANNDGSYISPPSRPASGQRSSQTFTSKNILAKVKQFESPESAEVNSATKKSPYSGSKIITTDGFEKFGARRRSSLAEIESKTSTTSIENKENEIKNKNGQNNGDQTNTNTNTNTSANADANANANANANVNANIDADVIAEQTYDDLKKSIRSNNAVNTKRSADSQISDDLPSSQHTFELPTSKSTLNNMNTTADSGNLVSQSQAAQSKLNKKFQHDNGSYEPVPQQQYSQNPYSENNKASATHSDNVVNNDSEPSTSKSVAAANFKIEEFNISNPDNTLNEVLLYLEHQTMKVISTIQTLLTAIKKQDSTRGLLREGAEAINIVVGQMTEATNISMNQTRNIQLKEHGTWVVQNLEDCSRRMEILCASNPKTSDGDYADKNFKQRLAGIAFDVAKSTKELVKSVEEASLKQEIEVLDARLKQ